MFLEDYVIYCTKHKATNKCWLSNGNLIYISMEIYLSRVPNNRPNHTHRPTAQDIFDFSSHPRGRLHFQDRHSLMMR